MCDLGFIKIWFKNIFDKKTNQRDTKNHTQKNKTTLDINGNNNSTTITNVSGDLHISTEKLISSKQFQSYKNLKISLGELYTSKINLESRKLEKDVFYKNIREIQNFLTEAPHLFSNKGKNVVDEIIAFSREILGTVENMTLLISETDNLLDREKEFSENQRHIRSLLLKIDHLFKPYIDN